MQKIKIKAALNLNNKFSKIQDVLVSKLKIIDTPGGSVLHGMKESDSGYKGFGEAYFSRISFDSIKAWKRHNKMTLNLIVPIGEIRFVVYDNRADSSSKGIFSEYCLSVQNYSRLTIPPGLWVGFQGVSKKESMLLNIANIPHDPDELDRTDIDNIKYNWELKK